MARFLSLTRQATPLPFSSPSPPAAARLLNHRRRSNLPDKVDDSEMEIIAMTKLEDAIHRIMVKRSEPDWLPLVPGGSYWVPAKGKANGAAQVIGKLMSRSMSKEKALPITYDRGWPSESSFFKGASNSPLEGEMRTKHTSESEDEEG